MLCICYKHRIQTRRLGDDKKKLNYYINFSAFDEWMAVGLQLQMSTGRLLAQSYRTEGMKRRLWSTRAIRYCTYIIMVTIFNDDGQREMISMNRSDIEIAANLRYPYRCRII